MNGTIALAPGGAGTWHDAWTGALDELELDVDRAEALLASVRCGGDPGEAEERRWQPPVGLPPLPRELRTRAQALLTRQITVAQTLATAATLSRRQAGVSARIHGRDVPARPVYVDRSA